MFFEINLFSAAVSKRSAGQKLINFSADEEFIAAIEEGRKIVHETRSLFIRKAIAEKLRALGIDFDDSQVFPPDRARTPSIGPITRTSSPIESEVGEGEDEGRESTLEEKVAAMKKRRAVAFGKE